MKSFFLPPPPHPYPVLNSISNPPLTRTDNVDARTISSVTAAEGGPVVVQSVSTPLEPSVSHATHDEVFAKHIFLFIISRLMRFLLSFLCCMPLYTFGPGSCMYAVVANCSFFLFFPFSSSFSSASCEER